MKKIYFYLLFCIAFSCTNNISVKKNSFIAENNNEKNVQAFDLKVSPKHVKDSLLEIIEKQHACGNAVSKFCNKSKNTKQWVRSGYGYVKVPDSIAYVKGTYTNGNFCCEGFILFSEDPEADGDEVGHWRYCTPDGTEFERNYKYSIGLETDSS